MAGVPTFNGDFAAQRKIYTWRGKKESWIWIKSALNFDRKIVSQTDKIRKLVHVVMRCL